MDILHVVRTGVQWRHLRPKSVSFMTIFKTMGAGRRLSYCLSTSASLVSTPTASSILLHRLILCEKHLRRWLHGTQPHWSGTTRDQSIARGWRPRRAIYAHPRKPFRHAFVWTDIVRSPRTSGTRKLKCNPNHRIVAHKSRFLGSEVFNWCATSDCVASILFSPRSPLPPHNESHTHVQGCWWCEKKRETEQFQCCRILKAAMLDSCTVGCRIQCVLFCLCFSHFLCCQCAAYTLLWYAIQDHYCNCGCFSLHIAQLNRGMSYFLAQPTVWRRSEWFDRLNFHSKEVWQMIPAASQCTGDFETIEFSRKHRRATGEPRSNHSQIFEDWTICFVHVFGCSLAASATEMCWPALPFQCAPCRQKHVHRRHLTRCRRGGLGYERSVLHTILVACAFFRRVIPRRADFWNRNKLLLRTCNIVTVRCAAVFRLVAGHRPFVADESTETCLTLVERSVDIGVRDDIIDNRHVWQQHTSAAHVVQPMLIEAVFGRVGLFHPHVGCPEVTNEFVASEAPDRQHSSTHEYCAQIWLN